MVFTRQNPPSGYYVYAYIREDLTPYYIGKGSGIRAWDKHITPKPTDQNKIIILEQNLTELGAFAIERRLIRWYGRKDINTGILRNLTDGGEGGTGGKSILGQTRTDETKEKLRKANIGKKLSLETCEKISAAKKGKKLLNETRQKISAAHKGKMLAEEHKEKLSSAKKGKTLSQEHREKIGSTQKGKVVSEETRQKLRNAAVNQKRNPCPWKGIKRKNYKKN
jgi:hypothetical protein